MPWTWRHGVLPPVACDWATPKELEQIVVGLISMGKVQSGDADGWRQRHLTVTAPCVV